MKITCLFVLAACALAATAAAQPTAFNYQGRLRSGSAAAQGLHDLRFILFDASVGGAQIGPIVCHDNVTVAEGLFSVNLDFGQQFVTPDQRFLEIAVRADTGLGCASAGGFQVLSPRLPLTAVPLALHARSAYALDAPDGSPANALVVDNAGNVGIGTASPAKPLHVDGSDGLFIGRDPVAGGFTGLALSLSSLSSGHAQIQAIRSAGSAFGTLALNPASGNVGIGTTSPLAGLHVLKEPAGSAGTLAIEGVTHSFLSFFPVGASGGRRGFLGFASAATNDLTIANETIGGRIVLSTPAGAVFAAGGDENLRIVRGVFAANGTTITGSGFSVSRQGVGLYTITFGPQFPSPPSVVATTDGAFPWTVAMTQGVTATFARIELQHSGNPQDAPVHFIAVGPR